MSSNSEPEYLRRAREEAEKDKRETQRKEQETAKERQIENLTAAIHSVEQEFKRRNDEHTPEKYRDRLWQRGGTVGLWVAAIVGLIAICVGNSDSTKQRGVMETTLDEMRAEQRPWVYFTNLKLVDGISFNPSGAVVNIQFNLANSGHTPAMKVAVSFNPFVVKDGFGDKIKRFEIRGVSDYFSDVVFPGNGSIIYKSGADIPRSDFDEAEKATGRILDIMAQICVEYEFPFADPSPNKKHKTCATIQVTRANGYLLLIPNPEATIPAENIGGRFELGGSYAD